jgi:hypothetical protein
MRLTNRNKPRHKKSLRKDTQRKGKRRRDTRRKDKRRKGTQRKRTEGKRRRYTHKSKGGAGKLGIIMEEIKNNGKPKDESDMKNQCFWISISDWKKKKLKNGMGPTVRNIKESACEQKYKCNDKDEQTDIMKGTVTIEGVKHILHNQESDEAIKNFAKKNDVMIRVFNRDTDTKIDIKYADMNKIREYNLDFGELENIDDQIWIAYSGGHFQLITKYKNENIDYNINVETEGKAYISENTFEIYNKAGKIVDIDIRDYVKKFIDGNNDTISDDLVKYYYDLQYNYDGNKIPGYTLINIILGLGNVLWGPDKTLDKLNNALRDGIINSIPTEYKMRIKNERIELIIKSLKTKFKEKEKEKGKEKGKSSSNFNMEEYYIHHLYGFFSKKLKVISSYPEGLLCEFKILKRKYIIGKTRNGLVIQEKDSWKKTGRGIDGSRGDKDGIYLANDQTRNSYMDAYFKKNDFELTKELISNLNIISYSDEIFKEIEEKNKSIEIVVGPKKQDPKNDIQLKGVYIKNIGKDKVISKLDNSFMDENMDENIYENIRERIISKKEDIISYGIACYPIIHNDLIKLIKAFIKHKIKYGSSIEKEYYTTNFTELVNNNTLIRKVISKYINRLLFKRPKTFYMESDQCKFRTNQKKHNNGVQKYDTIGITDHESEENLTLENTISYNEMEIAAMVSMSWKTPIFNIGNRTNGFEDPKITRNMIKDPFVIYIGCIGARFERKPSNGGHPDKIGKMEYRFMIINEDQNTKDNGYGVVGLSSESQYLKMWHNFFVGGDDNFPVYEDAAYEEALFTSDYTKINILGETCYLNNKIYKARMRMSILPFLLEAENRGKVEGKEVYCHLVGLGIGVWAVDAYTQALLLYEIYYEILNEIKFNKIKVLDFSWFPKPPELPNKPPGLPNKLTDYEKYEGRIKELINNENKIKIILSRNEPFEQNEDKHNKLIVAQFAWDSNAYPGNEFWIGQLDASGDPAAACCSGIAAMYEELNNGENQKVRIYNKTAVPVVEVPVVAEEAEEAAVPVEVLAEAAVPVEVLAEAAVAAGPVSESAKMLQGILNPYAEKMKYIADTLQKLNSI